MSSFLISFLACSIGSLIGIGGGVIIVPLLLGMGVPKELAAFSSSAAVLAMAILSSITYKKRNQGSIKTAALMGIGSIPGSTIGVAINKMVSQEIFDLLFATVIILLIIVMVIKSKLPPIKLKGWVIPIIGVFVGILSGTFGIGGGPIIVPCLLVLFSFNHREASATSVYITLITTANALLTHIVNGNTDMSLAIFMIPAAIIGSKFGTYYNKKVKEGTANLLFISVLIMIFINQII